MSNQITRNEISKVTNSDGSEEWRIELVNGMTELVNSTSSHQMRQYGVLELNWDEGVNAEDGELTEASVLNALIGYVFVEAAAGGQKSFTVIEVNNGGNCILKVDNTSNVLDAMFTNGSDFGTGPVLFKRALSVDGTPQRGDFERATTFGSIENAQTEQVDTYLTTCTMTVPNFHNEIVEGHIGQNFNILTTGNIEEGRETGFIGKLVSKTAVDDGSHILVFDIQEIPITNYSWWLCCR